MALNRLTQITSSGISSTSTITVSAVAGSITGVVTATSLTVTGDVTSGMNVSGIVTATTVQVGSATTIHTTGIDLGSGNITSHNINSTGIITSTSFVGPVTGNVTGNLTGNVSSSGANTLGSLSVTNDATVGGALTVTGDLTVNGTTTTIDTAVTAVDSLAIDGDASVGGALTATGNITANAFYGDGSNLTGIDATQIVTGNTSVQTVDTGSDGHVKVNTEGTERLRITSGGNIGIGTDNPTKKLTVYGSDTELVRLTQAVDSGTQQEFGIGFAANLSHTHPAAQITYEEFDASDSRGNLLFYTRGDNSDSAPTERLRITSGGNVRVPDNGKFTCGDGDDLKIYHNGTNNYIDAYGDFYLRINNGTETSLYATANGKVALNYDNNNKFETTSTGATVNGTLVTSGTGGGAASLGSHLDLGDNQEARFGASDDLKIYHNASSSFIDNQTNHLYIRNNANDSDIYIQTDDGSGSLTNYIICDGSNGEVSLRHYGTQKLKTTSGGIDVTGGVSADGYFSLTNATNSAKVQVQSDISGNYTGWKEKGVASGSMSQASIDSKTPTINDFTYPNSSNGMLIWSTSKIGFAAGSESPQYGTGVQMLFDSNGLALGNHRAFDRTDGVSTATQSTIRLYSTTGNADFDGQVSCDGLSVIGTSYMRSDSASTSDVLDLYNGTSGGSTRLKIRTYANGGGDPFIFFDAGGSNMVVGNYWQGTTNNLLRLGAGDSVSSVAGMEINGSGHCAPTADNSYDMGTSSKRWRNVYTADLQMSNEGSANDIDGTWGKYTIQEGENDLFLINRRSGKKYKFMLQEV